MPLRDSNDCKYYSFRYTLDKSVGLYNYTVNDVYHSVFGAKSEGWEKFVRPLDFDNNFVARKNLRVLDICYGIGYNTKAFLKKILLSKYTGTVIIDALEYDKNLVLLSPFVKDGYFKSFPELSLILMTNLYEYFRDNKSELDELINCKSNKNFLEPFYVDFLKNYHFDRYNYDPLVLKRSFVHNIYSQFIMARNKSLLKPCNRLFFKNRFKVPISRSLYY